MITEHHGSFIPPIIYLRRCCKDILSSVFSYCWIDLLFYDFFIIVFLLNSHRVYPVSVGPQQHDHASSFSRKNREDKIRLVLGYYIKHQVVDQGQGTRQGLEDLMKKDLKSIVKFNMYLCKTGHEPKKALPSWCSTAIIGSILLFWPSEPARWDFSSEIVQAEEEAKENEEEEADESEDEDGQTRLLASLPDFSTKEVASWLQLEDLLGLEPAQKRGQSKSKAHPKQSEVASRVVAAIETHFGGTEKFKEFKTLDFRLMGPSIKQLASRGSKTLPTGSLAPTRILRTVARDALTTGESLVTKFTVFETWRSWSRRQTKRAKSCLFSCGTSATMLSRKKVTERKQIRATGEPE
eukprot:g83467.t1